MAQIKEIAAQYEQLADHGVQIVLISPQPHKHTQKLAQRFEVPFIYLIIFADLTDNYRVRPEPETFMRVLKGAMS